MAWTFTRATLDITAGVFTDRSYFVSDGIVEIAKGAEYDAGYLGNGQGYGNGGKIELNGGTLNVVDSYLALNNGGEVLLSNSASNPTTGGASTQTTQLVNSRQTIAGAGTIGGAFLQFVNGYFGVVDATDAVDLVIATGVQSQNAGLMEATNTGGLLIEGSIDNDGELEASHGNLDCNGKRRRRRDPGHRRCGPN